MLLAAAHGGRMLGLRHAGVGRREPARGCARVCGQLLGRDGARVGRGVLRARCRPPRQQGRGLRGDGAQSRLRRP